MNQICLDSGGQIQSIVMNTNFPMILCEGLEDLCNSLLIGQEAYLRNFKSEAVIPVLMSIIERNLLEVIFGDVLVMAFRVLSLVLEFVPSSYNMDEEHHISLLKLASQSLRRTLSLELSFINYSSDVLIEECLRVIRFVGKDDRTGMSLSVIYVEDLLHLCYNEHVLVARQGLETFLTLCSKVVLPSEIKRSWDSGVLGLFRSEWQSKSARQRFQRTEPPRCKHLIVVNVENIIGPSLLGLIEKFCGLDFIPEVWSLFELAVQCLGTLIERALLCYRPSTARAISYDTLPALIFKVISKINLNTVLTTNSRNERILLCETFLSILASSNRKLIAENLLEPNSKDFFRSLFEHTEVSITTSLEDPFTRVNESGAHKTQFRDKDNIITISAIHLFISALPQVPLEAFGRRPKFPLPVHHWMWEDEMRHSNQINETHCMCLEIDYFKLSHEALITAHAKVLPADLHQMTLFRGSEDNYRNIFRCFTPFVYRYVDEKSLRPVLEAVKEAGPQPMQVPRKTALDFLDCSKGSNDYALNRKRANILKINGEFDKHNVSLDQFDGNNLTQNLINKEGVPKVSSNTIPEQYLIPFCKYASQAPGQMAKELAIWACAAVLQMCLLAESTQPPMEKLLDTAMLPLCEMFQKLLKNVGKSTMALVLSMIEWLFYRDTTDPLSFCRACVRSGLLELLTTFCSKTYAVGTFQKQFFKKSLEKRSDKLRSEIVMRLEKKSSFCGSPKLFEKTPGNEHVLEMSDAVILQRALNTIKEITISTSNDSDLTSKPMNLGADCEPLPIFERKVLHNFFVALKDSSTLTSYELQSLNFASVILRYLLNGKTMEDLFGGEFVYLSGASGSTLSPTFTDSAPGLSSILNKQQLQWIDMLNRDTYIARLLDLHSHQPRVRYFLECARQIPEASELLIRFLIESLSLNNELPLIESIAFPGSVKPITPASALDALSNISPCVALCSKASRVGPRTSVKEPTPQVKRKSSLLNENHASKSDVYPLRQQESTTRVESTNSLHSLHLDAADTAHRRPSRLSEVVIAPNDLSWGIKAFTAGPQRITNNSYIRSSPERKCSCHTQRGPILDIFSDSHHYITHESLKKRQVSSLERLHKDRIHLFASVGDIERFFRIGTASSKGTQTAPGPATAFNMDKLLARTESFLESQLAFPSAAGKGVVEVVKLLRSNPPLLQSELEKLVLSLQTRRSSCVWTPLEPPGKARGESVEVISPRLSDEQAALTVPLLLQAIEERYVLYRPFTCGPCPLQSTFLSHLYHQCVVTGDHAALGQLEAGLLAVDDTRKGSEVRGNPPRPAASTATGGLISPRQVVVFHHFETDLDERCACGAYSRVDFASVEVGVGVATTTLPKLARSADALLLVYLHHCFRTFDGTEDVNAAKALWLRLKRGNAFVSSVITAAAINSLRTSALRVSVLPPQYALPRWLNFVFNHAYFLLPKQVRHHAARFLAYGARRFLVNHMQTSRYNRFTRCGTLLPGEWTRASNHKFTVDRSRLLQDAYTVLCKSSDLRLPISLEFIGDLGVGQGPTAQFYSLLAKELCKERLRLWRNTGLSVEDLEQTKDATRSKPLGKPSYASKNSTVEVKVTRFPTPKKSRCPRRIAKAAYEHLERTPSNEVLIIPPPEGLFPSSSCFEPVLSQSSNVSFSWKPSPLLKAAPQKHLKRRSNSASYLHKGSVGRLKDSSPEGDISFASHDRTVFSDPRAVLYDYVQHQRDQAKAFYVVGAVLGRVFVDDQVFPLSLSPALSIFARRGLMPFSLTLKSGFDLDMSSETPFDLLELPSSTVGLVDQAVSRTLQMLDKMDNSTLKSLEIFFTLPGDDSFELIPGGSKLKVTKRNLQRYKRRVTSAMIYESVQLPLRLFTRGFADVVPPTAFSMLDEEELMALLCGADKHPNEPLWSEEEISSVLVGDHGYRSNSPQLKMLAHILSARFTPEQQRAFLQFCTGCPSLPLGGVSALGVITVVKSSTAFSNMENLEGLQDISVLFNNAPDNSLDPTTPQGGDGAKLAFKGKISEDAGRKASLMASNTVSLRALEFTTGENGNSPEMESHREEEWPLPSVNTCFRYLKLPPYPTEELMFKKLQLSISYSGDTFELS
ncbi:unnamed protein product [Phytomonas sp. EM1]|nr:unnamed protein product [Phytomonas sp. EM1]|eukprot:CCW62091.1 unnamed protein product [Phytomonas sp. isolate EM1]